MERTETVRGLFGRSVGTVYVRSRHRPAASAQHHRHGTVVCAIHVSHTHVSVARDANMFSLCILSVYALLSALLCTAVYIDGLSGHSRRIFKYTEVDFVMAASTNELLRRRRRRHIDTHRCCCSFCCSVSSLHFPPS